MSDRIDAESAGAAFPAQLLRTFVDILAYAIRHEAKLPSAPDSLARLRAAENAAQLLLREIVDPQFRALLIAGNERLENETEGVHLLWDVVARVAQAQERNRPNRGPGSPRKVRPAFDDPNALELCALMVGMLWRVMHNRWPGKDNPGAQGLCEGLWKMAGGKPHGAMARNGRLTAWRDHLKAARQYEAPHPTGAGLAGMLAPSAPSREKPRPGGLRRFYKHPRPRKGVT